MKYCIIYSSKHGSTKRCAALLAANLGIDSCDLYSISDKLPDISEYDFLIFGSYIRMGKADKKIIKLVAKYHDTIPYAVYLCGMIDDKFTTVLKKCFTDKLLDNSICTDFFGSDYKPSEYHGFDNLIVSALIRAEEDDSSIKLVKSIMPERITKFAEEIISYFSEE